MGVKPSPPYLNIAEQEGGVEASPGSNRSRLRNWRVAAAFSLAGLVALALAVSGQQRSVSISHEEAKLRPAVLQLAETKSSKCAGTFTAPPKPKTATELNGVVLDDVCYTGSGPHHVFIIGDWGGKKAKGHLSAVSHLNHRWNQSYRFVYPIDDNCQFAVRNQMRAKAPASKPDYVLNVGDNFYWGGVEDHCTGGDFTEMYSGGGSTVHKSDHVDQFKEIFEDIYTGEGLDGKMWLGVLGNHDWGGWRFDMAWTQAVGYTWNNAKTNTKRWMTPALYWAVTVKYDDFSVDYYFMDTNVFDALPYNEKPPHNICGPHNSAQASCTSQGGPPARAGPCKTWFENLWEEQKVWLAKLVAKSTAEWRMVVTHFPPYWGTEDWKKLARDLEIDVIITGHRHSQNMHMKGDPKAKIWPENQSPDAMTNDFLDPTAWIVSGGGGGITSEHVPDAGGNDDQYGFVDLTISKDFAVFEAISHQGNLRRTMKVPHSYPHGGRVKVEGGGAAAGKGAGKKEEKEGRKKDAEKKDGKTGAKTD